MGFFHHRHRKMVFIIIVGAFLLGLSSCGGTTVSNPEKAEPSTMEIDAPPTLTPTPEPVIEYISVSVGGLYNELALNALRAENTYQDMYVEISGVLSTIDSDGSYFDVKDLYSNDYHSVTCYLKTNEQRQALIQMNQGDIITVRGQITSIGEFLGYSLSLTSIESGMATKQITTPEDISAFEGIWTDFSCTQQISIDAFSDSLDMTFFIYYGDPYGEGEWWGGWGLSVPTDNIISEGGKYFVQGEASGFDAEPFYVKITLEETVGKGGLPTYDMQVETDSEEFSGGYFSLW